VIPSYIDFVITVSDPHQHGQRFAGQLKAGLSRYLGALERNG